MLSRRAALSPNKVQQGLLCCSRIQAKRVHAGAHASMGDNCVVTPAWLMERLGQPGLKVLDASWYMPQMGRNGLREYHQKRVPGARWFDVDLVSNPNTDLPHMLPSNAGFSAAMDSLGITKDDTVVLYDGMGMFSAPRAWWTFKVFGHAKAFVLEGGLPGWADAGGHLESSPPDEEQLAAPAKACREAMKSGSTQLGAYPANLDVSKVRSWQQMLANVSAAPGQQEQVVDARSKGRFVGTEPEPRAGLKGGHIPGARNIPFPLVLEAGGRLKPSEALREVFQQAGLDPYQPLVGSCGSGLTTSILALAAYKLTGGRLMSIYDGSWSEWGGLDNVPISTEEP